jgi:putative DNA primase/helicase
VNVDDDDPIEMLSLEQLIEASPRCTDAGNADAFVARHGAGYRYVLGWDRWIAWNGQRWDLSGAAGRVVQAALLSAREDYALTRGVIAGLEEEHRQALLRADKEALEKIGERLKYQRMLVKWHEQSQNVARLHSVRTLLESSLTIAHTDLDTHPWLMNAANGTIDLRTGTLRAPDPSDYLTQISPVEFDPEATCPTWDAFLASSLSSALMVLYLQRLIGYSITGLTSEHCLLFFHGEGNNGKTTFFTALLETLGDDYGCAAPPDLLFMPRGAGSPHPTEIASLYGKRLASCAEIGEGQILDEPKVKRLTGGDPVRCRRMLEDWWTFTPTHTIFMAGQHKPKISGADLGIWRRVKLIPWDVIVVAVDKLLPEKLRAERPGLLAWCVRGCLEWQQHGFAEPDVVLQATAAYRAESDVVGQFLGAVTARDEHGRVTVRGLRERYESWCKDGGYEPFGGRRFNERVRAWGGRELMVREGDRIAKGWAGLRLRTTLELAEVEPGSDGLS